MFSFLRKRRIKEIEPINIFEQLEERIVLDATVNQVNVNNHDVAVSNPTANVAVNAAAVVDIHSASEGSGGTYSLKVDGQDVASYNASHGNSVDVVLNDFLNTGKFTWTPKTPDLGTHNFEVTSNDGGSGADPHTDIKTVQLTAYNLAISSLPTAIFTADTGLQSFNVNSNAENVVTHKRI